MKSLFRISAMSIMGIIAAPLLLMAIFNNGVEVVRAAPPGVDQCKNLPSAAVGPCVNNARIEVEQNGSDAEKSCLAGYKNSSGGGFSLNSNFDYDGCVRNYNAKNTSNQTSQPSTPAVKNETPPPANEPQGAFRCEGGGGPDGQRATILGVNIDITKLDSPCVMIKAIPGLLLFVVGAVSVIFIIVGGIQYVVSAGNPDAIKKAKTTIFFAIIGLVVAICSQLILNFIIGSLSR